MARPSKYETHVAPRLGEVADWLRNGATEKEVAERLGIAMSTFCEYKRQFSEFSEVLKKTRDAVDGEVENALLQSALKGNTAAQIFWLKNRRSDKWRDKPIDSSDESPEGLKITIERSIVNLSKDKDAGGGNGD